MTITGDLDIDGVLGADTIITKKIEIEVAAPDPDTGKSSASIGEANIAAGESEIVVETTAVKDDSKIFVTASSLTDKVLSVSELVEGESFKVKIPSLAGEDIKFNWWLVQVAAANSP